LKTIQAEQYPSPKAQALHGQVNALLYNNEYTTAQAAVSDYLKATALSDEEEFYGYLLQAEITKSAGNPRLAATLLQDAKLLLSGIEQERRFMYLALLYGNIAECLFDLQRHEQAALYANQSIAFDPTNELKNNGHAVNHLILGYVRRIAGDFEQAKYYYNLAIASYTANDNPCELPLCYLKIADIQVEKKQYQQATALINLATALSDSCEIPKYQLLSKMAQVNLLEKQGRYKNALEKTRELNELQRFIIKRDQLKLVSDLQIKYQTALAKTENEKLKQEALSNQQSINSRLLLLSVSIVALLLLLFFGLLLLRTRKRKNTELQVQLEKINWQNQEREALLKEVHHRVKNNLQVITSLLHLQANDKNAKKEGAALFQSSQNRINAMALVHEMLYQSNNVSKISLPDYIQDLAQSLHNNFKKSEQHIDLDLQVAAVHLGLDTAIPLGLLLNELLSNAFTHGLSTAHKGKIEVRLNILSVEQQRYELRIGDNGVGLGDCKDLLQYQSLGFSLVRRLVRQLQGHLEVLERTPGCYYRIEFTAVD
jgi:two-component sensor histidine kinase